MFKLPLLQPNLTGPNGVEKKESQSVMAPFASSGSKSGKESDLAAAVAAAQTATFDVRSWSRQARDITTDLTASEKYKSLALHAEVKLAEALERCERVSPLARTPAGEEKPNKLRTAVACQLLGEFAELCGPFSGVLTTLRDEMVKAIYSWYYVSDRGQLAFDQLPWFSVAERLEREKEALAAEREGVRAQMAAQAEVVARIEEQMQTLKRSTDASQLEAAALRTHLERLSVSEESARLEAKTGREELKKLRKEYLRIKDELEAERGAHSTLQAKYMELSNSSSARIKELGAAADAAAADAEAARKLADSRMPPEQFEKLKEKLAATQAELEGSEARNKDLEQVNSKLAHRLDIMTPRPMWRKLADHGLQGGKRTAELVHRVEEKLGRYANELEELKARLALAAALLQPDPAPTEVQLTLVTDASSYFLTEGGDGAGEGGAGAATAEPCGLAASVPRVLRWPHRVPLQHLSLEHTEALVATIWKAKQAMSTFATAGTLQSFLYYYFNPSGLATQDSARLSYSLYNACTTHAKASPLVRTFWLALTGQVSEDARLDQQAMVSGLCAVLAGLPTTGGGSAGSPEGDAADDAAGGEEEDEEEQEEGGEAPEAEGSVSGAPGGEEGLDAEASAMGSTASPKLGQGQQQQPQQPEPLRVRTADVADALERLFPNRPSFRLNKLRDALHAQFPGESLPLDQLLALLQPYGLQPPPYSAAAATRREARYSADVLLGEPAAALPPLLSTLLGQHIDEVQAVCMELASQMADVEEGGGEGTGVGVAAVVEKLGSVLPGPKAMRCVLAALGMAAEDHGGSGGDGEGEAAGGGAGLVLPSDLVVHVEDVGRRILQGCLVKPPGNYDVVGAVRWVQDTYGSAAS